MNSERRIYVETVLDLYLALPDTPSRTSRYDCRLAIELYDQSVPLETVEAAFLLGSARRAFRDPSYPALGPIRSLHYFLPIIEEVRTAVLSPDYVRYLRHKLAMRSGPLTSTR